VEIQEDDQRRIVTAYEAIKNGADYVVVGRPISTSGNPVAVVDQIQEEIQKAVAGE
jgi:orotidine-5'-phosphate decarboxylase